VHIDISSTVLYNLSIHIHSLTNFLSLTSYLFPTYKGIKERVLCFALVDSRMFRSFDGTWSIRTHSRYEEFDPMTGMVVYKYNTKLTYSVFVAPKGTMIILC